MCFVGFSLRSIFILRGIPMNANYHTHSEYCGHAGGTLQEYIESAISQNLQALGFSEHAPFPGDPFGTRMTFNQLPDYVSEFNKLRDLYQNKIDLHIGLEIEYFDAYASYYPLLFSEYGIEYLIMGQHFFIGPDKKCYNLYDNQIPCEYLIKHCQDMIKGMDTGFFKYIAHPDLMFIRDYGIEQNCKKAISTLIEGAEKGHHMLELNANGLRREKQSYSEGLRYPYPVDIFWQEVAKTDIPVIIGSDSHSPNIICDEHTDYALEYALKLGLNLVETPLKI